MAMACPIVVPLARDAGRDRDDALPFVEDVLRAAVEPPREAVDPRGFPDDPPRAWARPNFFAAPPRDSEPLPWPLRPCERVRPRVLALLFDLRVRVAFMMPLG
jgi:hypothetical protein